MPWLLGTALLHSAIVVEKRDALKAWTLLLSILTFGLSLLGTFLVRSGIITSVHAFAQDPTRGMFILGILVLALGGSLALFAWRAPALRPGGLFAPVSREGALVLNNLLLATAAATVLLGTLYPLALEVLGGASVSVGAPYYALTFVPLSLPLIAIAAIGPFLGWKRGDIKGAMQCLWAAGALGFAGIVLGLWISYGNDILAALCLGLGLWLLAGTVIEWIERVRLLRVPLMESWRRARFLPRAAHGMSLAHAGLAIAIIGMTASAVWKTETVRQMRVGETIEIDDFAYRLDKVAGERGLNYIAERATFTVLKNGQYMVQPMPTTEAAIEAGFLGDLYAVIGEEDGKGGWTVRIYHEPLVPWIWAGAGLMVLGGIVSLSDRRYRVGAPNRQARAQPAGA